MNQMNKDMEFIRFRNCIVANVPLQKYCNLCATPTVNLVFIKNFKSLPLVGFSICSAWEIIKDGLHPNQTVSYKSWDEPKFPEWAREPVKANDYLRIILDFGQKQLRVRFRYNLSPPTDCINFDYPQNRPIDVYLALASFEMFDEPGITPIAILNTSEMLNWMSLKIEDRESEQKQQNTEQTIDVAPTTSVDAVVSEPPMCTWCCERIIDVLLMPCNHAVCCKECKDKYISHERNKMKFTSDKSTDIVCPICRKKIEQVAQIWFPKDYRCKLCVKDCGMMSAVAGGKCGCGCVIGCYEKAEKLYSDGGWCPICGKKIVEILQIFIQCDRDQ